MQHLGELHVISLNTPQFHDILILPGGEANFSETITFVTILYMLTCQLLRLKRKETRENDVKTKLSSRKRLFMEFDLLFTSITGARTPDQTYEHICYLKAKSSYIPSWD